MSNSPKKAGRRTKDKKGTHENIPPSDPAFLRLADDLISDLSVDPIRSIEMSNIFGLLITHRADDHFRKFVGVMLALMVENGTSDMLEELFSNILAMKRNAEAAADGQHHRNAVALLAWKDFVVENGFKPTKPRLKKFILGQPKKYYGMPSLDDGKGWTRVWKAAGLHEMEG